MFAIDSNSNLYKGSSNPASSSSGGRSPTSKMTKRSRANLDISKEAKDILEILNTTGDNKQFLIQWSAPELANNSQSQLCSSLTRNKVHHKIIDYFSTLPDFGAVNPLTGTEDGDDPDAPQMGLLTQACQQTHNLRDATNNEPDIKKPKTWLNTDQQHDDAKKLLLNDIYEFNRLIAAVESPKVASSHKPLKNTIDRTSTPRAKTKNNNEKEAENLNLPSDDSLLVATLSQFESKENLNQKKATKTVLIKPPTVQPVQKKFMFNGGAKKAAPVTPSRESERSFTRFKSDPLHNSPAVKKRLYGAGKVANNVDDDDEDVDLLFSDENLLKIIDSAASVHDDTLARNLHAVKKAPSLPHLAATQNKHKMIEVPSRSGLKLQRMSSSDAVMAPGAGSRQSVAPAKSFYGANNASNNSNCNNFSQGLPKYTNEQIEFKRQQALLKLKQKALSKS